MKTFIRSEAVSIVRKNMETISYNKKDKGKETQMDKWTVNNSIRCSVTINKIILSYIYIYVFCSLTDRPLDNRFMERY